MRLPAGVHSDRDGCAGRELRGDAPAAPRPAPAAASPAPPRARRYRLFELANVARPGVIHQDLHGFRLEYQARAPVLVEELLVFAAILGEEVLHQRRNIFLAVAQRRQRDIDHVQPIVEILAELGPSSSPVFLISALVAATIRTSTPTVSVEPSGDELRASSSDAQQFRLSFERKCGSARLRRQEENRVASGRPSRNSPCAT